MSAEPQSPPSLTPNEIVEILLASGLLFQFFASLEPTDGSRATVARISRALVRIAERQQDALDLVAAQGRP